MITLGPSLEMQADPIAQAALARKARWREEHAELLRIAAVRALALHEQIGHLSADDLLAARIAAAVPRLDRALGSGDGR